MSVPAVVEYLSIGGNRHSAASDWSSTGTLAFGADQNVAIWRPLSDDRSGIQTLLREHQSKVTAVRFLQLSLIDNTEVLVSGAADGQVLVRHVTNAGWQVKATIHAHEGTVNTIATLHNSTIFATGGSNGEIKIWSLKEDTLELLTTVLPKPRIIPLAICLGRLPSVAETEGAFLVAGGTRNEIHVYALKNLSTKPSSEHQATLRGHEGWIRSLALKTVSDEELILASASHDKYVRLWKFGTKDSNANGAIQDKEQTGHYEQTLTAKVQTVAVGASVWFITFEALLLGHEDWVYSAAWNPTEGSDQLLTASADGSLTIWEPDPSSGIWISESRLGEISGQKGATTATGSAGGFWTGMWSPDGTAVTCLGRTGSWRLWRHDDNTQYWVQTVGIGGHVESANSLTWDSSGAYLLSTSSDQTSRLHAEWRRDGQRTWHEFSRPQIHGYDLNCLASTGPHQFVSGADEKLLRVFNEPRDIAGMLKNLAVIQEPIEADVLPHMAAIPVLGLSNKAMGETDDFSIDNPHPNRDQDYTAPSVLETSLSDLREPPHEDLLARHTLWPEHEKLYGHGYEISECASQHGGLMLATACRASSTDHAVIRVYDTKTWNEIKPPLTAHSLTVTRLAWSRPPSQYLLSVGRDRQWSVFQVQVEQSQPSQRKFILAQSNAKAHTRMILDCAWSPLGDGSFFATAGRDKCVKIWARDATAPLEDVNDEPKQQDDRAASAATGAAKPSPTFSNQLTVKRPTAVTAISLTQNRNRQQPPPDQTEADEVILATGEESGLISLHFLQVNYSQGSSPTSTLTLVKSMDLDLALCPSKAINRLAWRIDEHGQHHQLAIAAADGSVRVLRIA